MQTERKQLINEMATIVAETTTRVQQLKLLDAALLNQKNDLEAWSVLECIEHLNRYGDFYLPEIEKRMLAQQPSPEARIFKSGMLGDYFANLMRVKPGGIKKMKTPADKNPLNSKLPVTTLDRFLKQQDRLLSLLQQSGNMDITRTRCSISISKLVKLRLGDTFRFLVYHIERHVAQAERAARVQ